MRLRASDVATAVGGTRHGPDVVVDGASIDSRTLTPGQLFVPVRGARDGHAFIGAAVAAGAAAYLTHRAPSATQPPATAIAVADTERALLRLGSTARDRLAGRVVGITGSSGKTTTKDLLAATLATTFPTAASQRSFNNELGLPLTLLNVPDGTDAVVTEMGARGPGHIRLLCEIARPVVGVVTNVSAAHTAMFGTVDDVAVAKGELVEALPTDGVAVLNADDERVTAMRARTSARVMTFGEGPAAETRAEDVRVGSDLRPSFALRSPWGDAPVRLAVLGRHQVANGLAAAAAAMVLGVPLPAVVDALSRAQASGWRMELERAPSGALVLNDSYNANPASTEAALRALTALDVRCRIAVLGPMLELGALAEEAHAGIGRLTAELGVDRVITIDAPLYRVGEAVADLEGALAVLRALGAGDAVLVKGSRAAGLDRLASALLSAEPTTAETV